MRPFLLSALPAILAISVATSCRVETNRGAEGDTGVVPVTSQTLVFFALKLLRLT
jgi:hypothetical protein